MDLELTKEREPGVNQLLLKCWFLRRDVQIHVDLEINLQAVISVKWWPRRTTPTDNIYIYICIYIYMYMHAVKLLSGPSLGFLIVIVWSRVIFDIYL